MARIVAVFLALGLVEGNDWPNIAGYTPGSDVTKHANLDLDQRALVQALKGGTPNWELANHSYAFGNFSLSGKAPNGLRTMKGFSTGAEGKMYNGCDGCPYKTFSVFYDYYEDFDYADKWVSAALDGTNMTFSSGRHGPNDFATLGDAARIEAVKKGTAYMNVWMYVIREFEDAIDDCETCVNGLNCNEFSDSLSTDSPQYNAVHAWDEGVAFYAGSLEGPNVGGSSAGEMVYRLAEKRCANFGTCESGETGLSNVNKKLLADFIAGEALLMKGLCHAVRPIVDRIIKQMTVPLVQGSLRYAYKVGMAPEATDRSQKNAAEGAVFTAAVLPLVHECNVAAAKTISDEMKFGLYDQGVFPDFAAVKAAFESTYDCLGITCADVGGLSDTGVAAPCSETSPWPDIAGYTPGSDVTKHANLDLDQQALVQALKGGTPNWELAEDWYAVGGYSLSGKAPNGFRTMKGFSTGAEGKMYNGNNCAGCPYKTFSVFYDYYEDFDYADKWVSAALDGTNMTFSSGRHGPNDFATLGDAARIEAVKKGTAYMNVWMYVIREFEDAIDDCETCVNGLNCNEFSDSDSGLYNAVHAWDEGVAFYAGSLEGPNVGGSSAGEMVYRLAEKRCANFGTCESGETGLSNVNKELLEDFIVGEALLKKGLCHAVRPIVDRIIKQMTVPLVQGSLRYAYKVGESISGEAKVGTDRSQKNAAEGAVFTAAVLPLVHECNVAAAKTISDEMKFGLYDQGVFPDFAAVKAAFESTYDCLGITCADVGGLSDTGVAAPCSETSPWPDIAGYTPGSDVTKHANLDLDQQALVQALKGGTPNWELAEDWYAVGGYSLSGKAPNGFRTMKGFSTGAEGKMYNGCDGCPYKTFSAFYDYYEDFDYADKWVSAALDGTNMAFSSGRHGPNDFATLGDAARIEAVKKGTAYMNVWMYVIREFEDAIDDCETCADGLNCNEFSDSLSSDSPQYNAVHAWDEGVAFYAGSLEGPNVGGSSAGEMVYRLAEKRCANFGTCESGETGLSNVNKKLLADFTAGEALLKKGLCHAVRPIVDRIIKQMTVPLVQGSLRYAYKVGMAPEATDRSQKNAAEGAVFTAAVLPLVHECNVAAAKTISDEMKFGLYDQGVFPDFAAVKAAFESTYDCLGITCADVGGLSDTGVATACQDAVPDGDDDDDGGNTGAIIGAVIGGVALGVLIGAVIFLRCRKARLASPVPVDMMAPKEGSSELGCEQA